jgi:hypothetical protein
MHVERSRRKTTNEKRAHEAREMVVARVEKQMPRNLVGRLSANEGEKHVLFSLHIVCCCC